MRFPARLAAPCAALLLIFALAPRPLAAQSGAIGIRGDVNRDGGVTAVDALAVLSHVVGKPLPATYTVAQDGDADGNGQVTALDALVILGHAVGKDVARYPVGRRILSGTVGSAGGAVVSPGDSIRLDFPEGALAGEVTVTVQPAAGMAADGGKLPGAILELGPSGQRFAKPVRLTLRFDPASVPEGVPASELRIHRREGDGWVEVPGGSVDVANGTVAAELSGFSTYAVMPRAASGRGLTLAKEAGDAQTGVAGRPPADFLVARLTNAAGRAMQGVELAWTVTEGGGSIRPLETRTDGEGRVRAVFTLGAVPGANAVRVSAAGAEAVVFTATGVADAPAAATVVAGADQTAVAGTAVATPPAVRVTDSSGNPVVDVAVTFAVAAGGGSVAGGATRTNASGVATVGSWTLGTTAGPNTLAAAVQGGPTATIAAVGLPGAAAAISVRSGDGGTATVATTRALEAKVVDAHGNGVPGVTVAWAVATGGGSLSAPTSATDAAGVASAAWTLGGTAGTQTATASAAGLAGSPLTFTVATTPAAASQLVLAAQPSATARSGIALAAQPVAQLRDAFGNAVPQAGVAVTAAIAGGGGTLGGTSTVSTDASGAATFTDLAISGTVGQRTLAFSAGGLTGATSNAIDVAAGTAAGLAVAAGDGQTAVAGSAVAVAPSVRVVDASGNPVSGVGVAFAVASGGGSVAGASATTDASGVAAVGSWTLGTTAGANTLTASSTGLASVAFGATGAAGAAAAIAVQSGDGGSAQVGTTRTLEARVVDANGNPVQGTTVSWAVTAGGGSLGAPSSTTDAAGVASVAWTFGTTAGAQGATASAAGLAGSPLAFAATATPAPASRLAVATQPSASARSGIDFAAQPVVQIQDAFGNAVAQSGVTVTAAIAAVTGTLGGTPTTATDAAGRATFAGLSISGATGAYTLGFTAAGLADAASGTITLAAGNPAALVVATQPSATAQSGIAFATQPAVQLRDASGNAVSQAGVTVTAAIASGGGTLGGTATATTDASGLAVFGSLAISGTAGQRTLSFASTGLTGAASTPVDVVAGAPASLTISTQPSSSAQSGIALATQPVLQLRDADGNAVPQAGVPVTASIASGTGTLGGTATVATDAAGRAAFTDLAVGGPVGSYTLGFASAGLAGATSGSIALAAGAPASLAVNAGNGQSAAVGTAVATAPSVVVRDASSNPVAGVSVTFAVASGNGSVTGGTATTDASGIATVGSWTLGTAAGANTLTASAGGLTPVTFTATATAGAATQLVLVTQPSAAAQSGVVFGAQPALQLRDAYGNDVAQAGVSVTTAIATGGGTLGGTTTVTTNASGQATFSGLSISGTVGDRTLSFSAGGVTGATSNTISITAGAASQLVVTTQPSATVQNGAALATQPVVQLRDADGNTVAQSGVPVTASIASGGGTLGGMATVSTDASGAATFTDLSITGAVGARTLAFSAGGLTGASSNTVTVSAGAAASLAVNTGNAQTAAVGTSGATAPSVLVRDGSSNPVAGVIVTFAVATGGGSVTGGTATTDASGIATVGSWTLGTTAGANTLTASASGLTPATFTATATAGAATQLVLVTQPSATAQSGIAFGAQPALQLRDAYGNDVAQAGVAVTAAIASGGGTLGGTATVSTNASGQATFSGLSISGTIGDRTLSFSAGGVTGATSNTISVTAGAASQLVITRQPSSTVQNGSFLGTAPVLRLRDASGNDVAQAGVSVTVAIASGGPVLSGTTVESTDAAGQVVFGGLVITGAAGDRTLGFTAAGLAGDTSAAITVTPGPAATIGINAGDGQTATAGSAVSTAPSVIVRDVSNNPVPGVSVAFAVASGGGSVTGGTATTGAGGIATVGSWTLGTTAGANTLTASSGGLTPATFTATGVAGPAATISIQSGNGGTAVVASTRTLEAKVVDANGNPVAGQTVSWAAATGGGSVSAPTSTTSAAGVASVGWTLGTAAGAQTATATSAGLAGSPLTFTATTTAAAAAAGSSTLAASPASITADGSSASILTVQLRDAYGNAVGASAGTVALSATSGTLSAVTDNGNGTYTATLTAPTAVGSSTVSGTLNGGALAGTATVAFVPGAAARYTVTPSAATATAGGTVTITAQLVDANGNAVPAAGRTVTWSSANGGSFASPTSTTDAAGVATVVFTTSTTAGTTHTVTADDGSVVGTSGSVVTQTGAASAIVKSGADGVSLAAGSAVTPLPTVRVTDANGNGVPGVSVVFAVTAGGGSVTGTTQTTDATGAATVGSWTLGTTAGANTLSATAGSLSAGFAVTGTVGPASAAGTQITTANAALTSGSITTVTVQVRDQYGNALTTGGATVALATDLGTVGPVTDVGNGTYTADLTHTGTNGVATVTGTLGGTPITDNAQVSFQAGGIQRTWTGLAGSGWSTAGSWSPRGTPTSSDTIVINGGGTQPQVTDADKTILRLVMTSAGGTLDLGGFKLVVTGDAVASGGVVSNGVVQMTGSSRSIQGTVPNLLVTGSVSAGGSTAANGTVTVSNGSLTVSNTTLTIKGQ